MAIKQMPGPASLCYICGGQNFGKLFSYDAPPDGETLFPFSSSRRYHREILCCSTCKHCVSVHRMDMAEMYQGDYGRSTYGGKEEIQRAFYRIASLDPAKSDNNGRVKRIAEFASAHLTAPVAQKRAPTILDVGSGLGVFLHRMKEAGWECQALDTDPQFVDHARDVVGVKAMVADYLKTQSLGLYDVVTFNKVLEHVANPSEMLARSTSHLREGGFVYVEVPDAEAAALAGPNREEFFIEHHHIFSLASFALLAARSNFVVQAIERLREPSGKYTLRAFLVPHSWGKNERDNLS